MNEKTIFLKNIKPNNWNPNEMTKQEFAELVKEVKHLGKIPKKMVLRKKGDFYEIVDGEHSYKALQELGIEEIQEDYYEIVEINDIEAKRQTYKRNLGGKNNPVKLGLMFSNAKEESGLSNRELADKLEISEGMIRNYLIYVEVGKLRNDYATIAKLNVDQIRTYQKIAEYAKPVADYWLSCGGLKDALLVLEDNTATFTKATYDVMATIQKLCLRIMEQGFYKILPLKSNIYVPLNLSKKDQEKNIQKFKDVFNRSLNLSGMLTQMEGYFIWNEKITKEYILEYLAIYYDPPRYFPSEWIPRLFSTSIRKVGNKLEFMLTPEEFRDCMEHRGSKEGLRYIMEKTKELIKKKYNIPTYQIKESYEPLENKLDKLEMENTAPDYIKESSLPFKLRCTFLGINFPNDEDRKSTWELLEKNYQEKDYKKLDFIKGAQLKEKIQSIIENTLQKEKIAKAREGLINKSEQELAELFVEKLKYITRGDKNAENDLVTILTANFTKEYLYLFVCLASKYYNKIKLKEYLKSLLKNDSQ